MVAQKLRSLLSDMTKESSADSEPRWWQAPWEFAIHAVVGALIFVLIAAPAVGINLAIHWLENKGVGSAIIWALMIAEYALVFADLLMFLIFLFRASLRIARKL